MSFSPSLSTDEDGDQSPFEYRLSFSSSMQMQCRAPRCCDEMKNIKREDGLKFALWSHGEDHIEPKTAKKSFRDHAAPRQNTSAMNKLEAQRTKPPSSSETDLSSNSSDSPGNSPVRVCSDCSTTKTPLWRSGPNGPKSLCNACGIRQRKARQALAIAASASESPSSSMKTKLHHKEKMINKHGHASKFKKHCKVAEPPSNAHKKVDLEDFLRNLSKNSASQRVFPQEEKDAAILLMALSYGLVHG